MLALNIVNHSYLELLEPLDMNQVAPIGFIYIEKFLASLFGNEDWSLRIFPFISFLLSIPLIFKLNKQLFNSTFIALFSCALFSLNITLIEYSSEVKQYSSDVLICLILVTSALDYYNSRTNKTLILYSVISVLAIWFSNIAIIIIFTLMFYGLIKTFFIDRKLSKCIIPILLGISSFTIYYFLFINNHPTREMMVDYWSTENAFLPQNIFSAEFYIFFFEKTKMIFDNLFSVTYFWVIAFIFYSIGLFSNFKNRTLIFLLVVPQVIHFTLSALKIYPVDERLILYLTPFFITLLSAGSFIAYKYINKKIIKLPLIVLILPALLNIYSLFKNLPIEKQEVKECMEFINNKIKQGDNIYVSYTSRPAFDFYKNQFPQINKCESIIVSKSDYKNTDLSKYDELLTFKGKTWVVFSHPHKIFGTDLFEKDYVLHKLKAKGFDVINCTVNNCTSAFQINNSQNTEGD